jgi:hypothetical protein
MDNLRARYSILFSSTVDSAVLEPYPNIKYQPKRRLKLELPTQSKENDIDRHPDYKLHTYMYHPTSLALRAPS